ncbi:hypothetical protein D3C77_354470 [compost metagenome]
MDRIHVISQIRAFQFGRQLNLLERLRNDERRMTGGRNKLGIKTLVPRMKILHLLYADPVHLFIRSSIIVEMIIVKGRLIIILIKIKRRIQLVSIPERHVVDMKRISGVALLLQQSGQAGQLAVAIARRHRHGRCRINRGIEHKFCIRCVALSDLLINVGKIDALSSQFI